MSVPSPAQVEGPQPTVAVRFFRAGHKEPVPGKDGAPLEQTTDSEEVIRVVRTSTPGSQYCRPPSPLPFPYLRPAPAWFPG